MKRFLFFVSLLFLNYSIFAQTWLWGRQGTTESDNRPVAADNNGNAYLSGQFKDSISFGSSHLFSLSYDYYLVKYDSSGNVLWLSQSKSTASSACGSDGITTDILGNVYVTGAFNDTVSFGSVTLKSTKAGSDVFLVKYDASGNVIWARQSNSPYSTSGGSGFSVATDASESVYITGWFFDTVSFGPINLATYVKSTDLFIVKYDANGNVVWANQSNALKGSDAEGYSIAIDNLDDCYVTGMFYGTISLGTDTLKSNRPSITNVIIAKFDVNGNISWARQSNIADSGANNCAGWSVIADAQGNAYITGLFTDSINFGLFALKSNTEDAFLVKYGVNGNLIWAKQSCELGKVGGGSAGYALAIDAYNNIYFSGGAGDSVVFCGDTLILGTIDAGDASIIVKLDTGGKALCGSIVVAGGDDLNGIASSPSGRYIYFGGDIEEPVRFNTNFLSPDSGEEVPFIARWQPCDIPIKQSSGSTESCVPFIPSAFSPNNDGQNDILYVRGNCINTMDFIIYDRWGNKVFESTNINTGWDGMYGGKPMNTGTYVYYLKGTLKDGNLLDKKGSVALVR